MNDPNDSTNGGPGRSATDAEIKQWAQAQRLRSSKPVHTTSKRMAFDCDVCKKLAYGYCIELSCPVGYHNVREMPLDDNDLPPDDPLEDLRHESYELGAVSVLESLGPRFRKLAGEQFALMRDEDARMLRKVAESFEKEAQEARQAYMKKYNVVGGR